MTDTTSLRKWLAIVAVWALLGVIYAGTVYFEVRAEGINLTNHLNPGNPGIAINNPNTFGRITSLAAGATPRIWQFAVKYTF